MGNTLDKTPYASPDVTVQQRRRMKEKQTVDHARPTVIWLRRKIDKCLVVVATINTHTRTHSHTHSRIYAHNKIYTI